MVIYTSVTTLLCTGFVVGWREDIAIPLFSCTDLGTGWLYKNRIGTKIWFKSNGVVSYLTPDQKARQYPHTTYIDESEDHPEKRHLRIGHKLVGRVADKILSSQGVG